MSRPLLTFIYSDHIITDDEWVEQGSVVNLDDYDKLNEYYVANRNLFRETHTTSDYDTWYYTYNTSDNTLTLPKTNYYFKAEMNESNLTPAAPDRMYMDDGLPNLSGTFTVQNGVEDAKGCFSLSSVGKANAPDDGNKYQKVTFNANASNKSYGRYSTVIPRSTRMRIYFYIGPKNKIS